MIKSQRRFISRRFRIPTPILGVLAALCTLFFAMLLNVLTPSGEALAQAAHPTGNPVTDGIISTILYSSIGIIMAFISFKIIDLLTPGNLSEDIANNNIALAILAGCSMLGVSIIIAAAIAG